MIIVDMLENGRIKRETHSLTGIFRGGSALNFNGFDIFMILFTILIVIGVVRSARHRNKLAVVYGLIALAIFLVSDLAMILNWFGALDSVLAAVGLS